MSPNHSHASIRLWLRLYLRLLTRLEAALPRRRNHMVAAKVQAWIDAEHARIHRAVHRDENGRS